MDRPSASGLKQKLFGRLASNGTIRHVASIGVDPLMEVMKRKHRKTKEVAGDLKRRGLAWTGKGDSSGLRTGREFDQEGETEKREEAWIRRWA